MVRIGAPWIFKRPSDMTPPEYREYLLFMLRMDSIRMRLLYPFWKVFDYAYRPSTIIREDKGCADEIETWQEPSPDSSRSGDS